MHVSQPYSGNWKQEHVELKAVLVKANNLEAQKALAAEAKARRKGFSSMDQCVTIESHIQLLTGHGIPSYMPLKRLRVGHKEDRLCYNQELAERIPTNMSPCT